MKIILGSLKKKCDRRIQSDYKAHFVCRIFWIQITNKYCTRFPSFAWIMLMFPSVLVMVKEEERFGLWGKFSKIQSSWHCCKICPMFKSKSDNVSIVALTVQWWWLLFGRDPKTTSHQILMLLAQQQPLIKGKSCPKTRNKDKIRRSRFHGIWDWFRSCFWKVWAPLSHDIYPFLEVCYLATIISGMAMGSRW